MTVRSIVMIPTEARRWRVLQLALILCLIPCLLSSGAPAVENGNGWPPGELIERVERAPWAEERGYMHIEDEEERRERIARDLRLDAWIVENRCPQDMEEPGWLQNRMAERRQELESEMTFEIARETVDPDEETLEQIIEERRFRRTIPPHYNVFYLLIEVPEDATEEEHAEYKRLTEEIAEETTPQNFADMARLWSDAPSAPRGGHMGSLTMEQVGPRFGAALEATEPGTVGGPFEIPSGFILVYVQSASEARPFAEEDRIKEMARDTIARQWLSMQRTSQESWEAFLEEYQVMEREEVQMELEVFRNYMLAVHCMRELAAQEDADPPEEDIQELYERQARLFDRRYRFLAREILVTSPEWTREQTREGLDARLAVRNKAREIREEIQEGLPFEEAARQYSAARSAEEGGHMGWITPPTQATLDRTLARLEPGEISVPIERRDGYWLLYLEERETQTPPSLEEMRPELEHSWLSRRAREMREELAEELGL